VRRIAPFEAVLIEAAKERAEPEPLPPVVHVPVRGPARVAPLGKNLLRLYDWQMALLDDNGMPGPTGCVPAVPLANQLATGQFAFVPNVQERMRIFPEVRLPELHIRYSAQFDRIDDGPVELVIEPDSIVGEWSVRVNDAERIGPAAFGPTDTHVRGSLGVDITGAARPGRNTITVDVRTDRLDGGLLNCLYVAGEFGVRLGAVPALLARPAEGEFEAYEANGLPYYAGAVEYEMQVDLGDVPADGPVLADLDFGPAFEDACEICLNGGPWHAVPWSPRLVMLPAGAIRPGENALRVRVYSSLGRAFEGQVFDPIRHAYHDVGERG
jgi:hypothetical protein